MKGIWEGSQYFYISEFDFTVLCVWVFVFKSSPLLLKPSACSPHSLCCSGSLAPPRPTAPYQDAPPLHPGSLPRGAFSSVPLLPLSFTSIFIQQCVTHCSSVFTAHCYSSTLSVSCVCTFCSEKCIWWWKTVLTGCGKGRKPLFKSFQTSDIFPCHHLIDYFFFT